MSSYAERIAEARKAAGKPEPGPGSVESAGSKAVSSPFPALRQPSGQSKPKVTAAPPQGATTQLPAFDDAPLLKAVSGLTEELGQLNLTVREQASRITDLEAQCLTTVTENAQLTAQVVELTNAVNDIQKSLESESECDEGDGQPLDFPDLGDAPASA